MQNLRNLRIEIKSDKSDAWVTIRAEQADETPGLRYIWFVLWRDQLRDVCRGKLSALEDGYHKAIIMGDKWTFFDMTDFPCTVRSGVASVPYVHVTIPLTFLKAVQRLARKTWRLQAEARAALGESDAWKVPEVVIPISHDHAVKVERLYGWGKGRVHVVMDERTSASLWNAFASAAEQGDRTLKDMIERLRIIARNQTRGFHDTAKLVVSTDGDGFYWSAYAPHKDRPFMNGGVINHAREPKGHDWSIHT